MLKSSFSFSAFLIFLGRVGEGAKGERLFCSAAVLLYFLLGQEEESSMEVSDLEGHFVCWTKPLQH